MENLFSIFLQHHTKTPEKIFLHSQHGDISYRLANHIIHRFGKLLHDNIDLQKTNTIAVSYTNPEVLFFVIWACIKSDLSLVLLPPLKDPEYITKILKQTGASYVISDIPELESISRNIELDNVIKKSCDRECKFLPHSFSTDSPTNQAAFIFHTSGTTGMPKLVKIEYSKFNMSLNCLFENDMMLYTIDQNTYIVPPLFHSYGLSSMLEYTKGGSAIKLPAGANFLDTVQELTTVGTKITAIEGVPFFYHYLILLSSKLQLKNLRHIGFGGDAVQNELINTLKDKFYGISFSIRYGLTETPSVVSLNVIHAPYADIELGGKILPIYDVKTLSSTNSDEDFRILIKGDCIGSYMDSVLDASADWFETGDNGYINNERLYVTGRESAFIKNRGYRISPVIIESIIRNYKGIKDCVVYSHDGELSAKIIADDHDNSLKQKLFSELNKKLPDYYVPKNIIVCEHIPRTISGKIIRQR